jgi:hypothetical protein
VCGRATGRPAAACGKFFVWTSTGQAGDRQTGGGNRAGAGPLYARCTHPFEQCRLDHRQAQRAAGRMSELEEELCGGLGKSVERSAADSNAAQVGPALLSGSGGAGVPQDGEPVQQLAGVTG